MECFFSKLIFHINKALLSVILFQFYDSTRYYHPFFIITEQKLMIWLSSSEHYSIHQGCSTIAQKNYRPFLNVVWSMQRQVALQGPLRLTLTSLKICFIVEGVGWGEVKEGGRYVEKWAGKPAYKSQWPLQEGTAMAWTEIQKAKWTASSHKEEAVQPETMHILAPGVLSYCVELQAQEQRDTWWGG